MEIKKFFKVFTFLIFLVFILNNLLPVNGQISNQYNIILNINYNKISSSEIDNYISTLSYNLNENNKTISTFIDKLLTNDNEFVINYPLNNDVLRAGDLICINGTIKGENIKNYIVEYGYGLNPKDWHNTGITLTTNEQFPIDNDIIAIWNTSNIIEPNFFTLRIKIIFKRNSFCGLLNIPYIFYVKDLHLDPTIKKGWPQRIPWYYNNLENCYYVSGGTQPVVSDLDNNGEMEIIVYVGGYPTKIYVFNQDGSIYDGWPVEVDRTDLTGGNLEAPTIGDIDNDGFKEIIVNELDGLYIYNHNGSLFHHIEIKHLYSTLSPTATVLFDLDNDGNLEIIRKYRDSDHEEQKEKLAVFDSKGNILNNWPKTLYNYKGLDGHDHHITTFDFGFTQAIGNFDDDSDWEIVATACRNEYGNIDYPNETFHHEGRVFVFNIDGTILDGFPVDIDGEMYRSSPCVADIDQDGYDDIIIGTRMTDDPIEINYCNPNTGLYVLDRFGNILSGWPQLSGNSIYTTPAVADFDNDGFPEIIVSTFGEPFNIYIFDYKGNVLNGWPRQMIWNDYRSLIVADANGDGNLDVITTAGNGFITSKGKQPGLGGVYAWNIDGSLMDEFPKVTEIDAQASATIDDIDGDGNLELIASSNYDTDLEENRGKKRGSIYVWNLDSTYNKNAMAWTMYHHDLQYSGYYISLMRNNSPPIKPTLDGPSKGKFKQMYNYTTFSSDPDGNQIYYWFDWGDGTNSGWLGPFDSGEAISINHTWSKMGHYEAKVKSKDMKGAWSFWSDPLSVNMSRNKEITKMFSLRFLERFPQAFHILKDLLET